MAHSPIVALVVITSELAGMISADEESRPAFVIHLDVACKYLVPRRAVMSVGVHHGTSPSQKSGRAVEGVPPPRISASSDRLRDTQGTLNPGRRFAPVSNDCIAPCLMARFLTSNCSSDSISASASLSAHATAACSPSLLGQHTASS